MAYHLHRLAKDGAKPRPHSAVIVTEVFSDDSGSEVGGADHSEALSCPPVIDSAYHLSSL